MIVSPQIYQGMKGVYNMSYEDNQKGTQPKMNNYHQYHLDSQLATHIISGISKNGHQSIMNGENSVNQYERATLQSKNDINMQKSILR